MKIVDRSSDEVVASEPYEQTKTPVKYFADQYDDEEVLYVFKRHPVVMRKELVLSMFGPLVGILPAAIKPELGFGFFFGGLAAGFFLGFLIMLPAWIGWNFSVFIVTDQRFIQITQKGLFTRGVSDIGLNQIQSINYEIKGLQETLLGFGTIKMQTYVGDMVINDVHHPNKIQKKLALIMREQGIVTGAMPLQPTPHARTVHE